MHYFIYADKDTWISSGSNKVSGESFLDQNYGQDSIIELKKNFYNLSFDYPTRILIRFPMTEISKSVQSGIIKEDQGKSVKYYLRLYEAEGNKELSTDYKLTAYQLSESWDEGVGKYGDSPKVTNGASWENRNNYPNSNAVTWSQPNNVGTAELGGSIVTGSWNASQSFSYESPDVKMDVTNLVTNLFSTTQSNYGFLLRYSGSQETDSTTFGQLKFFSSNTNTIYAPRLEVRWDDHSPCSGSNTGSLTAITHSGAVNNYVYPIGLRNKYKETEKARFRFGVRKQYIQKTFTESYQNRSGSYIPEGSGSYSILDVATGETLIPFGPYTSMSCDSTSPYFDQWLNTFYPDRTYKILIKIKYGNNIEQIFDDDFEFKIVR